MNNWLSRTPKKCWAYLGLSIWAILSFMLLHKTSYGIDEAAARSILLIWSVADAVVSPIVTMGIPDFRAIFLAPIGLLWTGSLVAAKVATILVMALAIWTVHAWRLRNGNEESALIASGLLLISPLALSQIDTISVAAYLLLTFGLAVWSDQIYRESPKAFGGMYFSQMFLCMVSVSLHPIGFAYPLALLWAWYKNPVDKKQQTYFFTGIATAITMALLLTSGWLDTNWFANPIRGLSSLTSPGEQNGELGALRWIGGITMLLILSLVIWKQARDLWEDLLGKTLLLASIIGLLTGDEIFGFVALATCLYWGLPLLLIKPSSPESGFWSQRGIVLGLTFILSTTFMLFDKSHYLALEINELSPRDTLIKTLAEDSGLFANNSPALGPSTSQPIRVASQWPGLTMLACRCDALPLPPEVKDGEALFTMLKGINYMIFDPRDIANHSLAYNLASLNSEKVETVSLQQGGVIVQIKTALPAPATEKKNDR